MLADVEAVFLKLAGGLTSPFAIRPGFVALFAGSTWLMARLRERHFGAWAGVLAAFALPDGPFLFIWLLTVDALGRASEPPIQWWNLRHGWDQVATEQRRRGLLDPSGDFLFTSRWYLASRATGIMAGSSLSPTAGQPRSSATTLATRRRSPTGAGRRSRRGGTAASSASTIAPSRWPSSHAGSSGRTARRVPRPSRKRPVRRIHLYQFVRQTKPFLFGNVDSRYRDRMTGLSLGTAMRRREQAE